LNVYTPRLGGNVDGGLPVLMYVHGGRFTLSASRDDDGTKLAGAPDEDSEQHQLEYSQLDMHLVMPLSTANDRVFPMLRARIAREV